MLNPTVFREKSSHQIESDTKDLQSMLSKIKTPAYVLDEHNLESNLVILNTIQKRTGCKILLALKAFSSTCCFPLISQYLDGVATSSLHETKLGHDYFKGNIHTYSPAYKTSEFQEIESLSNHIVFNSFSQWNQFKNKVNLDSTKCGIRINPEYSEVKQDIYNPCIETTRFGVRNEEFLNEDLEGLTGLHFHALCEQDVDVLERVWEKVEAKFEKYLHHFKWINLGGGHFITHPNYNVEKLITLIQKIQSKYQLDVILEPGEAVVLDAGYLVSSVLDIKMNQTSIAILDTSAAAHMPDVLEMPYRPYILGSKEPLGYPFTYKLGGVTCLSGDIIGNYSFEKPLVVGDKLIFTDMAQYSIVKNTTFNGVALPDIYFLKKNQELILAKSFGYQDFRSRVG